MGTERPKVVDLVAEANRDGFRRGVIDYPHPDFIASDTLHDAYSTETYAVQPR